MVKGHLIEAMTLRGAGHWAGDTEITETDHRAGYPEIPLDLFRSRLLSKGWLRSTCCKMWIAILISRSFMPSSKRPQRVMYQKRT